MDRYWSDKYFFKQVDVIKEAFPRTQLHLMMWDKYVVFYRRGIAKLIHVGGSSPKSIRKQIQRLKTNKDSK